MSSKHFGIQNVAYGTLNGNATPAALVGEQAGLGAVTDGGVGVYLVALDPEVVGMAGAPLDGGYALSVQTVTADRNVTTNFSANVLTVRTFDRETDAPADSLVTIAIRRWPNS